MTSIVYCVVRFVRFVEHKRPLKNCRIWFRKQTFFRKLHPGCRLLIEKSRLKNVIKGSTQYKNLAKPSSILVAPVDGEWKTWYECEIIKISTHRFGIIDRTVFSTVNWKSTAHCRAGFQRFLIHESLSENYGLSYQIRIVFVESCILDAGFQSKNQDSVCFGGSF